MKIDEPDKRGALGDDALGSVSVKLAVDDAGGSASARGGSDALDKSRNLVGHDNALFRKRFDWVFFNLTQALLLASTLLLSALVLFGAFISPGESVAGSGLWIIWRSVGLFATFATLVPQWYFLVTEHARPTWWMLLDFAIAGLSAAIDVASIAVAALDGLPIDGGGWYAFLAVIVMLYALRLYVRHAVYVDVSHARWHELHVSSSVPRVSSIAITFQACTVLVREAPLAQLGFLLCATVAAAQPPLMSLIVSSAVSSPPAALRLGPVVGALFGVILAGLCGKAGMSVLSASSFAAGSETLQRRLALKAVYGADPNTGLLTSTFSQGLAKVQSVWLAVYWTLVFNVLSLALNLVFLATVDWMIALVTLALLEAVYAVQGLKLRTGKASIAYGKQLGEQQAALENLIALRTAARSARSGWWLMRRWDALSGRTRKALHKSQFLSNFYNLSISAMSYAIYLFCISAIFARYQSGALTQEQSFAATGYLLGMISPNVALGSFSSRTIWSAGPVMNVFGMATEEFAEDAAPQPRSPGAGGDQAQSPSPRAPLRGPAVVVRDLVFTYPGAAAPTLKGLSAEVRPGEYVALCGGSGSGKTTLLRLIGRANTSRGGDSDTGSITVDGVPADDFMHTAFCTQSFDVLNGTVRDNISFGGEWDSLEDVQAAARLAEIAHVIERMPDGYETVIGRGSTVTLSGGQLARLGLARALCRRPRLLILDEVTSPLDPEVRRYRADSIPLALTNARTSLARPHLARPP
jgi:ABC-type multidrug transport system fused ATPase/permease subunit